MCQGSKKAQFENQGDCHAEHDHHGDVVKTEDIKLFMQCIKDNGKLLDYHAADAWSFSGGASDALIKSIRDIEAVQCFHAAICQKQIKQLPTELYPWAQAIYEETIDHWHNAHFIPLEFQELFNMAIIGAELKDELITMYIAGRNGRFSTCC